MWAWIILGVAISGALLAVFSAHIPGLRTLTGARDFTAEQEDDLEPFFNDYRP